MSQSVAKLRSARVSSQKARLVANQIRGKKVEEARDAGAYVEYVLFEDAGHGFIKKEQQIEGNEKILTFLENYLK